MAELLSKDEFRNELENAIKGRAAKDASFSRAWAEGKLKREHFVVATAALVVGLESQVPSIYKKQIVPLREVYGFTEDEIEFFDLHITSDVVHGERGYQIVLDHADTPQLQQRCLQMCRWGAEMRFSYTQGLYDHYVKPDLVGTTA